MKKLSTALALFFLCTRGYAADCSNPPQGFGGEWARAYRVWCESCCGTYSSAGPSCDPGPDWGCGGAAAQAQGGAYYDPLAGEIERQEAVRRRAEADLKRRENEEAEAKRQAEFAIKRDETLKSMKGIGGNGFAMKGLPAEPPAPVNRLKKAVHEWKQEFSGRNNPPDFPEVEGIERSPGYEAWLRGMDAVIARDWQLALAWFETAKKRDPLHPAIGRAAELADWTWQQRKHARLQTSKQAFKTATDAPKNKDLELLFFPKFERPAGSLRVPEEKDVEFLFHPDEQEDALIQLVFPGYRRTPPAPQSTPQHETARTAYADELAAQAILRVYQNDYEGAARLLEQAEKETPDFKNYGEAIRLAREWAKKADRKTK